MEYAQLLGSVEDGIDKVRSDPGKYQECAKAQDCESGKDNEQNRPPAQAMMVMTVMTVMAMVAVVMMVLVVLVMLMMFMVLMVLMMFMVLMMRLRNGCRLRLGSGNGLRLHNRLRLGGSNGLRLHNRLRLGRSICEDCGEVGHSDRDLLRCLYMGFERHRLESDSLGEDVQPLIRNEEKLIVTSGPEASKAGQRDCFASNQHLLELRDIVGEDRPGRAHVDAVGGGIHRYKALILRPSGLKRQTPVWGIDRIPTVREGRRYLLHYERPKTREAHHIVVEHKLSHHSRQKFGIHISLQS